MLIRDPLDLRRVLGKRLYDKQERDKLRFRKSEAASAQLSFTECVAPPIRCPLCDSPFRGRVLCWVCEAFLCERCAVWTTEGTGKHCVSCEESKVRALGAHLPTPSVG